ncbi:MAG TPA: DUF4097 family beta strand repeat-containing protein [Longimicrobiales bacterium]|nr:DUF4097 family beta strand repeat-containing protein [Longimicrobiales bacterium]
MLSTFLASLVLLAVPVQPTDTVIPVERGSRLEVVNHNGNVDVRVWDRDVVAIAGDRELGDVASITRAPSVIRVRIAGRQGPPRRARLSVTVPAWMPIRVNGMNTNITLDGSDADVSVETTNGDIRVTGGNGHVLLRTVQGAIEVRDSRGRLDVYNVNGGIRVFGATGDLTVETVNGSVTLEGIESDHVDATALNGKVTYDGTIRDGGRYLLSTHNGSIAMHIPEGANATVNVASMFGRFESDYPLTLAPGQSSGRMEFTLGTGSAHIELQTFNGTIRIARRGAK